MADPSLSELMTASAAVAVGMRLVEQVEAIVDRERPELPMVQRKAIAAQIALKWVEAMSKMLDDVVEMARAWRIEAGG